MVDLETNSLLAICINSVKDFTSYLPSCLHFSLKCTSFSTKAWFAIARTYVYMSFNLFLYLFVMWIIRHSLFSFISPESR